MTERRYERLHPRELRAAQDAAPVAWVPIGTLEFHGEHLPTGVDAFEAHGLCLRAAALAGGVVLPATYLASGCLDLPFTLSYDQSLVHAWAAATLAQLARRGYRVVVILTGHGPLDLDHLLKRVCAEAEAADPGLRAYGLCWLELNAATLAGPPPDGEPTVIDHAALVETSWMLALEPELVHLDRLSDDPDASEPGIYGRNPRFTASAAFGASQLGAAAELLAARVRTLLAGGEVDPYADLRRFVELAWPEPLELRRLVQDESGAALLVGNPGRASRFVSAVHRIEIDRAPIDLASIVLVNESPGETGVPIAADELGPERGFYVRRGQAATLRLGCRLDPGLHSVRLDLGLGGVARATVAGTVELG